jgi:hypothetical protein
MASHAGTTATGVRADVFGFLPGRTAGFGIPFHPFYFPFVDKVPTQSLSGTITVDGGTTPVSTPTARAGATSDRMTFGDIWFDRVHILPRTKFEFGNIITLIEDEYELYSAYRSSSITLTTITNNASPGIELPNVSAPLVVPKLTSVLDPLTTDNSAGTGLGTIVKTKIQALADGLPSFDTTVDFLFSSGDTPQLFVSGQRIVLIPAEYESPLREVLAFLTDIIETTNGQEQRIALRNSPRQVFEVNYMLDGLDRQRMQMLLMDWMDNTFGFPLWHEKLTTTAAVSSGATVYPVSGADDVDLRVGGFAVIITDANVFDVIEISAKTDTSITASSPSVNGYPEGATIMPMRTAVIKKAVQGKMHINNLEEFSIIFEVTDNDTGSLTGSTTPGFWSLYNSRVLFDDCNVVRGVMTESYNRNIIRIDNDTGVISQSSPWDRNRRTGDKGFFARSRAEITQLRKVLLALRGRQKSFYLPTFFPDLTVKATLTVGTSTMDIENINYVRFAQDRRPKKVMKITFNNGDLPLVRVVQSSLSVDSTTERLTLDTTWPSTVLASEVEKIEFYDLVRFNSDNFRITYSRIGQAIVTAPVRAVFDDNA